MVDLLTGDTGDIDGGTSVVLIGSVLDMSTVADSFDDSVIGALWTPINTGSGSTLEIGGERVVRLDSGMTANSRAGLRTVGTVGAIDVTITIRPEIIALPVGGTVRSASVALAVTPGVNELRLDVESSRDASILRITRLQGGVVALNNEVRIANETRPGPMTFRLVRATTAVIAYLNGEAIVSVPFGSTAATFEFSVTNDVALASRVRSAAFSYERSPIVTFGDIAVDAFLSRTAERVVVSTPRQALPGAVDITVVGAATTESIVDGFEYTAAGRKVIGRSRASDLVVFGDDALREA